MNHDSFAEDMEEIRSFVDTLRQDTDEARQRVEALKSARSAQETELAEARRAGRHGRDWQVLQQRIDMRRTTVDDIMNGLDHSSEARHVRQTLSGNLTRVREEYEGLANQPDGPLSEVLEDLRRAQESLLRTVSHLPDVESER